MAISRFAASRVTQGLPKYQSAWDQDNAPRGALEPIQSITVTAPVVGVTFSNIPQTFQDLIIVISGRTSYSNLSESLAMEVNGVTSGGLYSQTSLVTADTLYPGKQNSANNWNFAQVVSNTATNGNFSTIETQIFSYANTSRYKPMLSRHSAEYNSTTSGGNGFYTGNFMSLSAITSIYIRSANSVNLMPGSVITIYGVKAVGQ